MLYINVIFKSVSIDVQLIDVSFFRGNLFERM